MIDEIVKQVKEANLNLYDIAVMTDEGIEAAYCQRCNACNASYSITKLFIVTMIGILYDRGQLRLEDLLTSFLTDELDFSYDAIWDRVTIRDALTHSMGLDHGVIDIDRDDTSTYPDDYLRYIFSYPPKKEPGQIQLYTDVPHYLLSLVIEKITGKPAQESISEEILTPMGFSSVAWTSCPRHHTIGSSGAYLSAKDTVKLAWLYLNHGIYQGKRIISQEWVQLVEDGQFDLYPVADTAFVGKAGLFGQMTMFDRKRRIAFAWHGCLQMGEEDALAQRLSCKPNP